MRKFVSFLSLLAFLVFISGSQQALANGNKGGVTTAIKLSSAITQSLTENQMSQAKEALEKLKQWWRVNKLDVQHQSFDAYVSINQDLSKVSLDLLNNQTQQGLNDAQTLHTSFKTLQNKQSPDQGQSTSKQNLAAYVQQLQDTKALLQQKKWSEAQQQIQTLQKNWLAVEGDVVSQSQKVYSDSENNLVLLGAYVNTPDKRSQTVPLIDQMIFSLQPLADADYGLWDAALIPIREGFEALLVVGALLTFGKKANSKKANHWVWGGTLAGILCCLIVGGIVAFLFSSQAFGNNNSLINGWSGVIASLMLLYVSYWLHRNSDIKRWNAFIKTQTEKAMTNGRMLSFAFIAFLAIVREGMETVIFLIGMASRMSAAQLTGGIAVGFGILIIIGFLMLKIGIRLPLKPFFLISSLIVFYLCFKFMGSGIHSLQMAGIFPSTVSNELPSLNALSIYPSWYSALPQLIFLLSGIFVLAFNKWKQLKTNQTINQEVV
ncbi:FTR1 family iron permease [Pullulanibacillus sp. KACC 23026]|uniref:FTR1 family iron permease n=1 Tax=Pullulanibacillus sp. KACC 23026 TaxID=3028315 RepID=UPI0023B0B8D4|nr:FTR1 family protein [Pullulanibacillus sp. KACC 23026]WEG13713.1 FTR1 family iron permease [Pullulanibacillus sp. KACC 23026]